MFPMMRASRERDFNATYNSQFVEYLCSGDAMRRRGSRMHTDNCMDSIFRGRLSVFDVRPHNCPGAPISKHFPVDTGNYPSYS